MRETFRKNERLYLKKDFEEIFKGSNYFIVKPLKIYWKEVSTEGPEFPVKFGISVPKKNIAKATDRNKIKRQLREIYRKKKMILYNNPANNTVLLVLAVYTSDKSLAFSKIEQSLLSGLEKIKARNE